MELYVEKEKAGTDGMETVTAEITEGSYGTNIHQRMGGEKKLLHEEEEETKYMVDKIKILQKAESTR